MAYTPLSPDRLLKRSDAEAFSFRTTSELEPLAVGLGQPRAEAAVRFGIAIRKDYHLYAMGPPGLGKRAMVQRFIEQKARELSTPDDWCYVNNFLEPHKPKAIRLPAGMGRRFREDMERLVEELKNAIPAAFESEDYQARKQAIDEAFKERQEKALEALREEAQAKGIALLHTPLGFAFAPLKEGKVMPPEVFAQLPEAEKRRIEADIEALQKKLEAVLRAVPQWRRESWEALKRLNQEVAQLAVGQIIDDLRRRYGDFPQVLRHLDALEQDVIENVDEFLRAEPIQPFPTLPLPVPRKELLSSPAFRRYQVNLFIDHGDTQGAPVIYEEHPTHQNLTGRMEHMAMMGALVTDFNLLKPGTLHRANGGYLLIDAEKVLTQPFAWEALKRALSSKELRIESVGQALGLVSTVALEPEPIPLSIRVVLLGGRELYYLLQAYDAEFSALFKVVADFDERFPRTRENQDLYARLIAGIASEEELLPLDRGAVARVIEHAARRVEDAERLSLNLRELSDLLCEADHWAREEGLEVIDAASVRRAIEARRYRSDRIRERVQEAFERGILLVETEGRKIGQINGLVVVELADFAFGRPNRITATLRLGEGEVVDIEREVKLAGPIHAKGVLILAGFLSNRYARRRPLTLHASLVFEQSYGGIEGDSASAAELCALLSALAEAPIDQGLAITGSVDQHGDLQAIGAVNEKIEGFFDVCKRRGLKGQGVIIPEANVKDLMLREEVVEAASQGKFRVYAVRHIDECIELLTGIPAGKPDKEGRFPEGSINQRVEARLDELAAQARQLAGEKGHG